MSVTVIEFITLDGIVSDPTGSDGTPAGGWVFRHGPEAVAGDKFRVGRTLDDGVLLLGRSDLGAVLPDLARARRPVLRADERRCRSWSPPAPWPTPRPGRTRRSSTATSSMPSSASSAT